MIVGIIIGGCFVLIFGIIGGAMLFKYFQDSKKAEASQGWSSASGQITESYVRREDSTDNDGYPQTYYYSEVRYEYDLLVATFTGDKIAFGTKTGNSSQMKAQEALARYPVGERVTVYYDPNNREDAVLERRVGGKVFLIIGIVFSLVALCTLCIGGSALVFSLVEQYASLATLA
ncbi:MAG: DUF3592 domain-containing protein [Chloroflexi bacterium]|nr:DUF3592 domain-containing protein [Chloroflexota bacterium]